MSGYDREHWRLVELENRVNNLVARVLELEMKLEKLGLEKGEECL